MKSILEYLVNNHVENKPEHSIYYISKDRSKGGKYEFSSDELEEIMKLIESDEDYIDLYKSVNNPNYNSIQDAVLDFEKFLDADVYQNTNSKQAHKFYILDYEGQGGYSYTVLSTGKIVNDDNLYAEFKSIINDF